MANYYQIFAKYTEEENKKLLLILEDRKDFPDSYSDWVETTQNLMHNLASRGVAVYSIDVDADELAAWCRLKGYNVDSRSCLLFADHKGTELMAQHNKRANYAPRLEDQLIQHDLIEEDSKNN